MGDAGPLVREIAALGGRMRSLRRTRSYLPKQGTMKIRNNGISNTNRRMMIHQNSISCVM